MVTEPKYGYCINCKSTWFWHNTTPDDQRAIRRIIEGKEVLDIAASRHICPKCKNDVIPCLELKEIFERNCNNCDRCH